MEEKTSDSTSPDLRVLLDVEIKVDGLHSDADQPKLESALEGTPGIESLNFLDGKLAIRYDAEKVTETELREKISRAGFRIVDCESAPISPPIEPSDESS